MEWDFSQRLVATAASLILLLFAHGASGQNGGEIPGRDLLHPGLPGEVERVQEIRRSWELEAVRSAIRNGFYGVADTLNTRLLEDSTQSAERERIYRFQMQIALVKGNLVRARKSRESMVSEGFTPDPLMEAFLRYFEGDNEGAEEILGTVVPASLPVDQRAWHVLLAALILAREGRSEAANQSFLLAERLAPNAIVRDHFEVIRLREELRTASVSEESVSALREAVRSMRGERSGFEAARLLAVALHKAGQATEAIEVLSSHLTYPGLLESGLRPRFLLLLGVIAGPESTRGRLALRQLVSESKGGELESVALTLLTQATRSPEQRDGLLENIAQWLDAQPPHPLSDRLLAYQAYLLQERRDIAEAEESASELLERFPSSAYIATALRILAHTSWNQNPPRYRTAADFLNRLRQELRDPREILHTGILIADCYFLNGDFASASDAYGAVFREADAGLAQDIFFQRVLSEILGGRPREAGTLIDRGYADQRLTTETLWRAEWNLLDSHRREGRVQEAFARIRALMERNADTNGIPSTLILRMRWISARLNLEAGQPLQALAEAESLFEDMENEAFPDLPEDLLAEVESHVLLLMGEAHFSSGNKPPGMEAFSRLRERFPQSGPAILSYLVESRSESAEDNLVSAQRSLIDIVDRFPDSEYAPIALWEAALNAEQRGLNAHLQEAIRILEDLVQSYPDNALVYFARLKQGDLARRLNDFPTAMLIYERLLSQYPGHPERFRAEISRGDCLMSMGSEDPSRFDVAAVIYERNCLLPSAPLPVRLEAGFKWANAIRQQGDIDGCEAVFWILYERFILDPDLNQHILLEGAGRYWMARVLLEMGTIQFDKGEIASAVTLYQTLLSLDLPGASLAASRLEALH